MRTSTLRPLSFLRPCSNKVTSWKSRHSHDIDTGHLQAAGEQFPKSAYAREAQPLTEILRKLEHGRKRGPMPIADIIPIVFGSLTPASRTVCASRRSAPFSWSFAWERSPARPPFAPAQVPLRQFRRASTFFLNLKKFLFHFIQIVTARSTFFPVIQVSLKVPHRQCLVSDPSITVSYAVIAIVK